MIHPMHLHGFPFTVNSFGMAGRDSLVTKQNQRLVVTQFLTTVANTMRITWVPEKEGNWLFHCHLLDHVLPESFLRKQPMNHATMSAETHAREGMGGLVMGMHVSPDKKFGKQSLRKRKPERTLRLIVGDQPQNALHNIHGKGFQLTENGMSISKENTSPGPPIILTKDQPVAIKVINKLKQPTSIHWHGLEIESYYDGVAGWGSQGKKLSPLIQPGDSFIVHMAPPRAGTFIYHTHMHDKQLLDGLYGALIVLKPGESNMPATDKVILISQGGADIVFTNKWNEGFTNLQYLINGSKNPKPLYLKKGMTYRLRIINISAQQPEYFTSQQSGLFISLKQDGKPVKWKLIDKDGMDIPARLHEVKPADRQRTGHGATTDFEFTPEAVGDYVFEVKVDGAMQVAQVIKVEK
jgi:FtsP/CotA-like multicopper oxidase with cupredoxin domain